MKGLLEAYYQIKKGYSDQPLLRRVVFWDWLRILLGNRFVPATNSGVCFVVGQPLEYSKRASLYGMYQEIFIAQNYFIPYTNAPLRILDCGSNIGMATKYFLSRAPNSHVIAFEPNPHTAKLLRKNLAYFGSKVEVHEIGLDNSFATLELFTDVADSASQSASVTAHLKAKKYSVTPVTIKVEPLSPYITEPIDILKMDIEGLEVAVIRELVASTKIHLVKKLFIEYHFDGIHATDSLGQMLSDLEGCGFHYIIHSGITFPFISANAPITECISYKITAWKP